MEATAALIQFPELNPLALVGIAVVICFILFGLFGIDYFKKNRQNKATTRMQQKAILEIYEEKKLSESETDLMDRLLDHHAQENPLRVVTTRDGFGQCVQAEMNLIASENDKDAFKETGVRLRDIRNALGLDYIPLGKPVYSTRELHVGQIISVAQDKGKKSNWIRMVLREIDEAYLYISRQSNSNITHFEDGDKVLCKLWREEDAQYQFPSRIVFHGESHAEWRLSHNTQKMERTQSREHFRMRYEQTTNVGILNASADEEPEFIKRRRAVTKLRAKITNLSAGGCAIVFQQPIARQVFLRIELELPHHSPIPLEAKIVAVSNISGGRSLVRARFIAATQEERDLISRFLRQRQQETLLPDTP